MLRFTPVAAAAVFGGVDAFLAQQDAQAVAAGQTQRAKQTQSWSTFGEVGLVLLGVLGDQFRVPRDFSEPALYYGSGSLAFKFARTQLLAQAAPAASRLQVLPFMEAQATQFPGLAGRREPVGLG